MLKQLLVNSWLKEKSSLLDIQEEVKANTTALLLLFMKASNFLTLLLLGVDAEHLNVGADFMTMISLPRTQIAQTCLEHGGWKESTMEPAGHQLSASKLEMKSASVLISLKLTLTKTPNPEKDSLIHLNIYRF